MSSTLKSCEERMKKSIKNLEDEFNNLRTGRASASLFDRIRVNYYGTPTPLNQVSNISTPEARLVVIQPWDSTLIGEIEKAIQQSELSLNPTNDGKIIRISIPPLTEERRKELVKHARRIAEQSKVALRNIRRDGNEALKKQDNASEDDIKRDTEAIQKLTDEYVKKINTLLDSKEKEIMEV